MEKQISFAVLTVSDSCFHQLKKDILGPELIKEIQKVFKTAKICQKILPDNRKQISDQLIEWSDQGWNVILTAGGTGCSPRDLTPEATRDVIEKEVPGISLNIMTKSVQLSQMSVMSRFVSGIRKKSLIINFPGTVKWAVGCFGFTAETIAYAVSYINRDNISIRAEAEGPKPCSPSKAVLHVPILRELNDSYKPVDVETAQKIIMSETSTGKPVTIDFRDSLKRVLAEDIMVIHSVPQFKSAIKDGYAVNTKGSAQDRKVIDCIIAGEQPREKYNLKPDEAIRISSGAPVPEGPNTVIAHEHTSLAETVDNKEAIISLKFCNSKGHNIRDVGDILKSETLVATKFDVITPGHIGIMAAIGKTKVDVFRRATVGVVATGNEIIEPEEPIEPEQIHDSNTDAIIALLNQYSYPSTNCGIARDDPGHLKQILREALNDHDIVLTTGGVSVGEMDIVKHVLMDDFGAKIYFCKVKMRPGFYTTFSTLSYRGKKKLVFSLPGSPASACVSCLMFVIPCLRYRERRRKYHFSKIFTDKWIFEELEKWRVVPVPTYARAIFSLNEDVSHNIKVLEDQDDIKITSMAGINALIVLPEANKPIRDEDSEGLFTNEKLKVILLTDI